MGSPKNQFAKSKSYILTSCLVAVSFAIINCQKAPNKNGVKPNVTNPAGTNTKTEEIGKLACTLEAKNARDGMLTVKKEQDVATISSSGKSDAEKDKLKDLRIKFLENCVVVVKELEKLSEKACLLELKLKAGASTKEIDDNNVSMTEIKQSCDATKKLLCEDGGTHSYGATCAAAATDRAGATGTAAEEQRKKDEADRKAKQSRATDYLKTKIVLVSDDVKELSKEKNAFKKYIAGGDIKSDSKALELANSSAKSIVCSISGNEIDKTVSKSVVMKFADEYKTVVGETALEGFKGDAMSVSLSRENDKSEKGMIDNSSAHAIVLSLTCLNVKASAVDIGALKTALGIKSSGGKHLSEITEAELKKQTEANAARFAAAKAEELAAAARAEEERRIAQGLPAKPAVPPAAGAAAADEKTTLIRAVTTARMALGEQKTKNEGIKTKLAAATVKINTTGAALTTKKVAGAEFKALALKIIEAAKLVKSTEAAMTDANKGNDAAAKTNTKKANDLAIAALATLKTQSKDKVKDAGTVDEFATLYIASLNAIDEQAALAAESTVEEAKVEGLQKTLEEAIKTALNKKVTAQELAAPTAAGVVPVAPAGSP